MFVSSVDPVALGLVLSLSRPGRNITGVTELTIELVPKQLEILRELAPDAHQIGLLVNPENLGTEPGADSAREGLATDLILCWHPVSPLDDPRRKT